MIKRIHNTLLISLLTLVSLPAWAGQLTVSPLSMNMAPEQANATYKLKNGSSLEGFYQIQLFAWDQGPNGETQLRQQDDLIITPPVTLIPGNGEQLVRVIQKNPQAESTSEKSYRLIISEVPDTESDQGANLRVLLRMSLPLFVGLPEQEHELTVYFQDGALRVRNNGTAHARLSDAYWQPRNENQQFLIQEGLLGYVLPGRELQIPLENTPPEGSVEFFTAAINGDPITLYVGEDP